MYYNTPFSLFPPNAAISLTDDNSTSFAARPAAFGPKLVIRGLSGQLWVGSGFAEDSLDGNGELGCSDLPGWDSGNGRNLKNMIQTAPRISTPKDSDPTSDQSGSGNRDSTAGSRLRHRSAMNDGTDNYLHQGVDSGKERHDASGSANHADIQSIQEAAEIEGKVVLLMRGGCGFLEKVMWAQRRGAVAVIVGDNQKGGPLIQMFAHGDEVDNVTIPSVFTARTTAHILSSLTQPGSFVEDSLDDGGKPVLKVQQGSKVNKSKKTDPTTKDTGAPVFANEKRSGKDKKQVSDSKKGGLFSRIFSWGGSSKAVDDKSRPPSSGRIDWVLVEDWDDENDKVIRENMDIKKSGNKPNKIYKTTEDNFVIGVQDWRDPDLREKTGGSKTKNTKSEDKQEQKAKDSKDSGKSVTDVNGPKGGSITPGSGEYNPTIAPLMSGKDAIAQAGSATPSTKSEGKGFFARLFGAGGATDDDATPKSVKDTVVHDYEAIQFPEEPDSGFHEGLWVTITPSSSASPFFDTLLVLVISPLVTLTVVYALLILRARIRRRRWRAPKSVVERLPVRTYHTVAASPSLSPRIPSPTSSSPTTPLLQQGPSPSRPRPRSRTTTGIPQEESSLAPSSALPTPRTSSRAGHREHEKGSHGFSAEWKKYMGRQVECVVCLEEYVDGVSKVMSLPCGHEFHVECM